MPRARAEQTARKDTLAFLTLLFMSLVLIFVGGTSLVQGARTYSWPNTTGTITESNAWTGQNDPKSEIPGVRYTYTVGTRQHQSDRLTYIPLFSRHYARNIVNGLSKGKQVRVYYDPGSPSTSVLIRGGVTKAALFLLFGLALLASALWYQLRR